MTTKEFTRRFKALKPDHQKKSFNKLSKDIETGNHNWNEAELNEVKDMLTKLKPLVS